MNDREARLLWFLAGPAGGAGGCTGTRAMVPSGGESDSLAIRQQIGQAAIVACRKVLGASAATWLTF
jgi:hypothetical protein